MYRRLVPFVVVAALALPLRADFEAGLAAYKSGNYDTALAQWLPLAESGIAKAQLAVAVMYLHGFGVSKDFSEAEKWYRKSAGQGYAAAQYAVGLISEDGERLKWIRAAADQGLAEAQQYLGEMYTRGGGVPRDRTEAAQWYDRAAKQGVARAQGRLWQMYASGDGVPRDNRQALKFLLASAEGGDPTAQAFLANLYVNGRGVQKDAGRAARWYGVAVLQGGCESGEFELVPFLSNRPRTVEAVSALVKRFVTSIVNGDLDTAVKLTDEYGDRRSGVKLGGDSSSSQVSAHPADADLIQALEQLTKRGVGYVLPRSPGIGVEVLQVTQGMLIVQGAANSALGQYEWVLQLGDRKRFNVDVAIGYARLSFPVIAVEDPFDVKCYIEWNSMMNLPINP